MFKSPSFVTVIAAFSLAGAALAAAPAIAGAPEAASTPYALKAKVVNGQTVYCTVKNGNSYELYQGCMTKVRWEQHGVAVSDAPRNQIAENTAKEKGKGSAQN